MHKFSIVFFLVILNILVPYSANSQVNPEQDKFKQLYQELPSPNEYRTFSGAPGNKYWQQKADYIIDIVLDDNNQRINGIETITYYNNSPDALSYLWIQLDQNLRQKNSLTELSATSHFSENVGSRQLRSLHYDFDGGFKLSYVRDINGKELPVTVNYTMMRLDLPEELLPGEKTDIQIGWSYNINDRIRDRGRSGYEYFADSDSYLYTIAQFYPRMAVYSDALGWQNKQFIGSGEFALPFGDYNVSITVPADHIIAATGELQNPDEVLSIAQIKRLEKAKVSEKPVFIVNEKEARTAEIKKSHKQKTWKFTANNVRDFAFASSRKFIWDAMAVTTGKTKTMAMSFYPKEGNPLWERYSTRLVAHTLKTYSNYTFDYPYPVAISVHTDWIGMEYPMISFNGGRPDPDGTYSERTKWGMFGTIIHEVGHNYFPMIVNSDERQWAWMDEGLNTFIQGIAERQWDYNNTTWEGNPESILDYMRGDKKNIRPIMTNPESIFQLGNNAYLKTASALTILRETVMGRELFDFAFKEYARRWMFKHPTPADFFRTMEDASAVDLDWFWRGWFYTTDNVDIALDNVDLYKIGNQQESGTDNPITEEVNNTPQHIAIIRDKLFVKSEVQKNPELRDKSSELKNNALIGPVLKPSALVSDFEESLLQKDYNYYALHFSNIGGLIMPLVIEFEFKDGSKHIERIPAEIWRLNNYSVSKVFPFEKELKRIVLDPFAETADIDFSNNIWSGNTEEKVINIRK